MGKLNRSAVSGSLASARVIIASAIAISIGLQQSGLENDLLNMAASTLAGVGILMLLKRLAVVA